MPAPDDPAAMAPAERLAEVAAILARGILRFHSSETWARPTAPTAGAWALVGPLTYSGCWPRSGGW